MASGYMDVHVDEYTSVENDMDLGEFINKLKADNENAKKRGLSADYGIVMLLNDIRIPWHMRKKCIKLMENLYSRLFIDDLTSVRLKMQ
jgi:hypothetical protein